MGKLQSGIHGPFTGKVGSVIGSKWRGINTIRVIPANYSDANTKAQQLQRLRMELLSVLLKPLKSLIKSGFTAVNRKASPFNNAFKYNIKDAVAGEYPDFYIDYDKLILSYGKLRNILNPVVTSESPATIKITWLNNTNNDDAFNDDRLCLCVLDEETGLPYTPDEVIYRKNAEATISLPADWSGKNIVIIGFTVKKEVTLPTELKDVSVSMLMGKMRV